MRSILTALLILLAPHAALAEAPSPVYCSELVSSGPDEFPKFPFLKNLENRLFGDDHMWSDIAHWSSRGGSFPENRAIQEWLRLYHGLKIPIYEIRDQLPFNVPYFLFEIFWKWKEAKLEPLSTWLKNSSAEQQKELFSKLKQQVYFDNWARRTEYSAWKKEPMSVLFAAFDGRSAEQPDLIQSLINVQTQMRKDGEKIFVEHRPAIIDEFFSSWNQRKVKLTDEGTIAYGDDGIPDKYTFELAGRIGRLDPLWLRFLPDEEHGMIQDLINARRVTYENALDDAHYQPLYNWRFTEYQPGMVDETIWAYIRRTVLGVSRYLEKPFWWAHLSEYSEVNPATGETEKSRITAATSRSPLLRMYGPNSERRIHWPIGNRTTQLKEPNLTRIRVAENFVNGELVSVEVLANSAPGEEPRGFFFVRMNEDLVPAKSFDGVPIEKACIRCHAVEHGSNVMAFKPWFLNLPEEFRGVGYRDEALIQALIREGCPGSKISDGAKN